jgi:predicted enzyme related to lactoylglutathione lyase
MSTKTKKRPGKKTKTPASIIWFEIPADNPERAKKFYSSLFGWKIKKFPGMADYWHIDTGGANDSPDGGLMARKSPQHPITNYVNVASLDKAAAKVEQLGGKICMPRTEVPEMGFFAVCQDTENNMFALWEKQ